MDEIARDLHVAYVMEGSVRKDGEQLRIGAKLVDVGQEKTLWAKTFDKGFAGIFDIQRQVALEVASVLQIQLDASAHFGRRYQPNASAYAFYLRGMFLRRKFSLSGLQGAVQQFHQAVAADPKFADAYVQLAGVYASVIDLSYSTDSLILRRADSLLSIAKTLEPDFSPYNTFLGFVADLRGDKRTAELAYRTGIEKDSSIWYSHSLLGWLLLDQGRNAEALDSFDGALRADPTVFTPLAGKAVALVALGRTGEALLQIDNALALEPANSLVLNIKAQVLMQQKDYTNALDILHRSLAADSAKGPTHLYLAEALALRGDRRECWEEWHRVHAAPDRNPSEAYALAILYASNGKRDSACVWLGRATDLGFSQDELMSRDARLSPLRGEPCVETAIGRARENRERWKNAVASN